MVHLALASSTNACFDRWAKSRGLPLWRLLLDLSVEQTVNLLDLSYLGDVLRQEEALSILDHNRQGRQELVAILEEGYPGYDTSIGWFNYTDEQLKKN